MQNINLEIFPKIVQLGYHYCIPASIEAMIKYMEPLNIIDQIQIMNRMIIGAKDNNPSFSAAEKYVSPILEPNLKLRQLTPDNYSDWRKNINYKIFP